jgi:hypothetical protein
MLFRKLQLNWRYGIAELGIVVAGVLIALAADGWHQGRQERATELEYVLRLMHDLELDTAAVSSIMAETEARATYARAVMATYDTGSRSGSPADFVRAVEFGNYFSYPSYSRTTIDDLMSTGNLRLIRRTTVKDAVARYYATIEWTEQFRELFRPTQLALMQFIPEFLDLDQRNALFQEGFARSCGPTLSCTTGIPWAPSELTVAEAEADLVLERLLRRPDARPFYANMARIQGGHYANLASIRELAGDALDVLERYVDEAW